MTDRLIPQQPLSSIPKVVLFYSAISFHLVKIIESEQQEEAVFHWRQVRYYRNEWQGINPPDIGWPTEMQFLEQLEEDGQCFHIVEAIKKFNLMEVE